MEFQDASGSYPYNSAGSFIEYFEGLTHEHVDFIFAGAAQAQEGVHPSNNTCFFKYGFSEPGSSTYYDHGQTYEINDIEPRVDEQTRPLGNSTNSCDELTTTFHTESVGNDYSARPENHVDCPRRNHDSQDLQVIWQDSIEPDDMTYEELLDLGEEAGIQNRGLSQELISLLPISKYKCGFFSRKKSREERCVICQMEYKHCERRITLPCKHIYHSACGAKWLSINKACPICFTEVFGDASRPRK